MLGCVPIDKNIYPGRMFKVCQCTAFMPEEIGYEAESESLDHGE